MLRSRPRTRSARATAVAVRTTRAATRCASAAPRTRYNRSDPTARVRHVTAPGRQPRTGHHAPPSRELDHPQVPCANRDDGSLCRSCLQQWTIRGRNGLMSDQRPAASLFSPRRRPVVLRDRLLGFFVALQLHHFAQISPLAVARLLAQLGVDRVREGNTAVPSFTARSRVASSPNRAVNPSATPATTSTQLARTGSTTRAQFAAVTILLSLGLAPIWSVSADADPSPNNPQHLGPYHSAPSSGGSIWWSSRRDVSRERALCGPRRTVRSA
jgi:hypothetical protein